MKIKGFTIVPDFVVQKYTAIGGLIYGKIARYCEWSDMNVCTASNTRLAKELNLGESTIRKYKKHFEDDGLIKVVGKSGATDSVTIVEEMVVSMSTPLPDNGHPAIGERTTPLSDSNKDTIKESNKDISGTATAIREGMRIFESIQGDFKKHLGLTPNWDTKTNQQYYQFFQERYDAGQTAVMFAKWWRSDDFRAKQNISLFKVKEQWHQAFMQKVKVNDLEAENQRLKELHG